MTLLLRVLAVFALLVCVEKPAHAQNQAWCLYKSYGDGYADCRYATFQHCLADRVGTGCARIERLSINPEFDCEFAAHERHIGTRLAKARPLPIGLTR